MSQRDERFSDEFLNAFLDNELADEDRRLLMESVRDAERLNARLCELRTTCDLVRLGFQQPPGAETNKPRRASGRRWSRAMAAAVLLGLGLGAGWLTHSSLQHGQTLMDIARSVEVSQADVVSHGPVRIMLHVTTDDRFKLATVLDEAEQLLASRSAQGQPVQVAILANGDGLDLLRADQSPFAGRIEALKSRYDNLTLLACGRAMERVREHRGTLPPLLPRTQVVPSALSEIINRRQEGWSYIRI